MCEWQCLTAITGTSNRHYTIFTWRHLHLPVSVGHEFHAKLPINFRYNYKVIFNRTTYIVIQRCSMLIPRNTVDPVNPINRVDLSIPFWPVNQPSSQCHISYRRVNLSTYLLCRPINQWSSQCYTSYHLPKSRGRYDLPLDGYSYALVVFKISKLHCGIIVVGNGNYEVVWHRRHNYQLRNKYETAYLISCWWISIYVSDRLSLWRAAWRVFE